MTTWNSDPVSSGRRRIVSSISTLVWNRWHSNKVHLFYFTVFSELFWSINNFFHYQKRLAIWVHFSSPTRKRKLPDPPPHPTPTKPLTLVALDLLQFLRGNWDANSVQYHSLKVPFWARYVRIVPTHWYNHICLRVELYGCKWNKVRVEQQPPQGAHDI